MSAALAPTVLWAERADKLFLTVELADVTEPKVDVQPDGKFTFTSGSADGKHYATELQLAEAVDAAATQVAITPRSVLVVVAKTQSGPYWGRLVKGKAPHNVKVDWTRYKDEDDDEAEAKGGASLDCAPSSSAATCGVSAARRLIAIWLSSVTHSSPTRDASCPCSAWCA